MFKRAANEVTRDLAQSVTDKLLSLMAEHGSNWVQPWTGSGLHKNFVTMQSYKGTNAFITGLSGFSSPYWGSFKQSGAQVNKGEKATHVIFFKPYAVKDRETDEERTIPVLRTFPVFNLEQVSNAPRLEIKTRPPIEIDAEADRIFRETGAKVVHQGDRAFYSPSTDSITLPKPDQFKDKESYHATAFHEAAHWTSHPTRLDRQLGKRFGDKAYAIEELIAETSAALTCVAIGLIPEPRAENAKYLNNWIGAMREDKRVIISVFGKAQAATDYILRAGRPEPTQQAKAAEVAP